MSDQQIMEKLKKFTVKDLKQKVAVKNKKYKDANPYKGYSTAKKDELIKMIMDNRNDFKDLVKIKEPITVESIKKKEEKKAVKKSVVKQDTKKEQPVKKPVTKTAKKGDVQGVTSKKTVVEQILNILKNGTKKQAKEIINFIVNVHYELLSQKLQSDPQLRLKYMNKKNDGIKPALFKPKNMIDILKNNSLKSLVNEINNDGLNALDDNDISIGDLLQKFNSEKEPVKKESITKATKKESNGKIEDKYNKYQEAYQKLENEDYNEFEKEFKELFKKVVEYYKENIKKMGKDMKINFKELIQNIKDKKNE